MFIKVFSFIRRHNINKKDLKNDLLKIVFGVLIAALLGSFAALFHFAVEFKIISVTSALTILGISPFFIAVLLMIVLILIYE